MHCLSKFVYQDFSPYIVEFLPEDIIPKMCNPPRSHFKSLSNLCFIPLQLSASNSQGFSRPSPPISYMTLPEAPGKMEKPKVNGKPKTNSISIKWGEFLKFPC